MTTLGTYNFVAYTSMTGDVNHLNDTIKSSITVKQPTIASFPYIQNFNSTNGNWLTGSNSSDTSRHFTWGTVPYLGGAQGQGKSWYLKVPVNNGGDVWIESPVFDFTTLTNPKLSMYIKQQLTNNNNMVIVQYSTNGGSSWTELGSGADADWYNDASNNSWNNNFSSPISQWTLVQHNLCAMAGLSCVKFRVSTSNLYYSGNNAYFALDNFMISNPTIDAQMISVSGCYGSAYNLEASIENMNNLCNTPPPITSINISYSINGATAITNTYTGLNIIAGQTAVISMPNITVPDSSSTIKLWCSLPNGIVDQFFNNDTTTGNPLTWPNCNDHCSNAILLTNNVPLITVNKYATINPAEDPTFAACGDSVTIENTVWYYFKTSCSGGATTLTFTHIVCKPDATGIQLSIDQLNSGMTPCTPAHYTNVYCSNTNNDNDITWNPGILPGNTTYYITTDGSAGGQCTYQLEYNQVVDTLKPATGIAITNDSTCFGVNKTLSPQGGHLIANSHWVWYSTSSCTPPALATGNTYVVNPAANTNYWLRAESNCDTTTTVTTIVKVIPNVAAPVFTLGSTSTRCQGAGTVTYTATATNTSGITYSLDNVSITGGNTINSATGAVTYVAGWSGTSVITASAAGCNGPLTSNMTVTITPTVSAPVFTLGTTSTRCQGAGSVTYTATAANSTGITYSLDNASITGGNSINSNTGQVTYVAGWSGTSVITASAAGCNGPVTSDHTVTITPTVGTPVFVDGNASTRCEGAGTDTYTANATNSTGITYSLDNASKTGGNSINTSTGE